MCLKTTFTQKPHFLPNGFSPKHIDWKQKLRLSSFITTTPLIHSNSSKSNFSNFNLFSEKFQKHNNLTPRTHLSTPKAWIIIINTTQQHSYHIIVISPTINNNIIFHQFKPNLQSYHLNIVKPWNLRTHNKISTNFTYSNLSHNHEHKNQHAKSSKS